MRVLMTTDCVGGVFIYTLELARALATRRCELQLAVMGDPLTSGQRAALGELEHVTVHERSCALEWMDDPWQDIAATSRWLLELAAQAAPDCVHLNEFAYGALPWRVPVVMVGHSCVSSWWRAVHQGSAPSRFDRYRAVVQAGLAAADCVVAPSTAMLNALIEEHGPLPRTRVIANGIALEAFHPKAKERFALCAGRLWDEAKNVVAVQRSAASLDWPVYVAGPSKPPSAESSGEHEPNYDGEYAPCRPLGQLSRAQLADVMARASIYVLPARYEPFGLSVLEAAASGCALVLGGIPSLIEHWRNAARFVDPNDPDDLTRALRELIEDHPKRERLAARAQQRSQRFAADSMADAYFKLYLELIERTADIHTATEQVPCVS